MTTKRETQAGDSYSQAMVYDSYNRIRRVSRDTNLVGEYDYDDQGFRVRKRSQRKVSGLENGQTVTAERWYELEYHNKYFAVERQKNMNGGSIRDTEYSINNIYLDGVRVATLEPSGAARYFLTDQVDSVKITADSSGKVVSRTEYHPYGETWFTEGVEDIAPKYNGQELDQESDFYYFNARHYDPELARFVTADIIVDGEDTTAGWNRYMYVHGNPIKYKDPTGHTITVTGDDKFKAKVAKDLSKLAGAEVTLDEAGTVSLGNRVSKKNQKGYNLIEGLVGSDNTHSIEHTSSGNSIAPSSWKKAQNDQGSDSTIKYNPESNPLIKTLQKDGTVKGEGRPREIGLAHELVHAEHIDQGDIDLSKAKHTYKDSSGNNVTQSVRKEELRTVGVGGQNKPSDITENDIRQEQGLKLRGAY